MKYANAQKESETRLEINTDIKITE